MIDFSKHTFEEIAQFYKQFHNQFVLLDKQIYKYVGFGEDEYDYYHIGAPCLDYEHSNDGLFRISAVCWVEPLKGKLSDPYYKMLEYTWELNDGPRPTEFLIEPLIQR